MKNMLKKRLKEGEQTFGVWMSVPSPDVVEALARVGFDWFLFDNEHSPLDVPTTQLLMQSLNGTDVTPIVRVPWNDMVMIKKTLDTGPYGLVIPWVNDKQEAINAVKACKYPPKGLRGYGPRRPGYMDPDYLKTADDEILVIVQIETDKAVKNIQEIFSVEGVDAFLIGPFDLSASMGVIGKIFDPSVQAAIDKVLDAGKKAGVIPGIVGVGLNDIKKRLEQGFQLITIGGDMGFLAQGAKATLDDVMKLSPLKKAK